jgi:hypothetical protein
MTIAPAGARVGLTPARLHHALATAPVGQQPLVEVALAWQRLRPPVVASPVSRRGYLPIVAVGDEAVAARVARLLSGLAFCVLTRPDPSIGWWQVDVPVSRHRPVTRALNMVWRDAMRQCGPANALANRDPEVAIALWRMASLIADGGANPHVITVGAGTAVTAGLLVSAAARLGVRADTQRIRRLPAVVVDEPDQLRALLAVLLQVPGSSSSVG